MNSASFQQNQEHSVTESGSNDSHGLAKSPPKTTKKTRRKKSLMEHYKIIESPPPLDSNNINNSSTTTSTFSTTNSTGYTPTSIFANIGKNSPTQRNILPSISSVISSEIDRRKSNLQHEDAHLPPILDYYNQVRSVQTPLIHSNEKSPLSNNNNTIKKRKNRNEPSSPLVSNTSNVRDFQVEYTGNNSIFGVLKKPKHANVASYETILNLSDTVVSSSIPSHQHATTFNQTTSQESKQVKKKRKQTKKP